MIKSYLIIVLFIYSGFYTSAQNENIPNISVDQLLECIEKPSDTIFVVNFWATWCQPCVKEIPELNKIGTQFENKPVKVIMASLDFPNQKESRLIPFIGVNHISHPVILLTPPRGGDWISKINDRWSGAIPATLVIHKGKRAFHEGEITYNEIVSNLLGNLIIR